MYQQPSVSEYRPRTIHRDNRQPLDILPAFPRVLVKTDIDRADLQYSAPFLTNVPSMYIDISLLLFLLYFIMNLNNDFYRFSSY